MSKLPATAQLWARRERLESMIERATEHDARLFSHAEKEGPPEDAACHKIRTAPSGGIRCAPL